MAQRFVRSVIWQALDRPGTEYSTIWKIPEGWLLDGTVCRVEKRLPSLLSYRIFCDRKWETRRVELKQSNGGVEKKLSLKVNEGYRWHSDDQELGSVRGCVDVDLLSSPVTNTLPIRRLRLRKGESQQVRATWVKFPEMTIEPLG